MRGVIPLAAGAFAALAALSPAGAGGDAARGEKIYERCAACHSLDRDRTGPRHCGLFGRRAGSLAGFDYSPAMRGSAIVWNDATLDRFLAAPTKVVPGTSMGYAGVDDPRERADLVAYLEAANGSRALCP
jgi:cytochrome c